MAFTGPFPEGLRGIAFEYLTPDIQRSGPDVLFGGKERLGG
jgi:hypothetical protein